MKKIAIILCIASALGLYLIPTVSIAATAAPTQPVRIMNTFSQPVPVSDVDNPARQPFQQLFNFSFDHTQGTNGQSFVVPAGKRLVIEFVSAAIALEMGLVVDAVVTTTVGGIAGGHHLIPTSMGPAWGFPLSYLISKDIRVYADPGTTVGFSITDNLTGNGGAWGTISGYLINIPQQGVVKPVVKATFAKVRKRGQPDGSI